jgi:hypothetical protein
MKKLGFKIKRSSAGNVYADVELKETFHKEWMENYTINNETVVEEILPYEIDMFSSFKNKRKIDFSYHVPSESLMTYTNAKDYGEKSK